MTAAVAPDISRAPSRRDGSPVKQELFKMAAKHDPLKQMDAGADQSTRDKLLDVAEEMFAKHGIDKVSLRAITSGAGLNVSAVHYHFGSKDQLLRAIFVRRSKSALEEQEERLATFKPSGVREQDVRTLMEAYIEPGTNIDCAENNYRFSRLLNQLSAHDDMLPADMFYYVRKEVDDAYTKTLSEVLPDLSASDLAWRLEFISPLVGHACRVRARFATESRRKPTHAKEEDFLPQLIGAATVIFCAPPTGV